MHFLTSLSTTATEAASNLGQSMTSFNSGAMPANTGTSDHVDVDVDTVDHTISTTQSHSLDGGDYQDDDHDIRLSGEEIFEQAIKINEQGYQPNAASRRDAFQRRSSLTSMSFISSQDMGSSIGSTSTFHSQFSSGYNHSERALKDLQELERLNQVVTLNKQIRQMEMELVQTYENGKLQERKYKSQLKEYEKEKRAFKTLTR